MTDHTPSGLPQPQTVAPDGWRKLLRQSEDNFVRQFGVSVAAAWVYRDLEELLAATDACQSCNGNGGTQTSGPCPECYGQGSYSEARTFVQSRAMEELAKPPAHFPPRERFIWTLGYQAGVYGMAERKPGVRIGTAEAAAEPGKGDAIRRMGESHTKQETPAG